jgi:carboxylesterase type B
MKITGFAPRGLALYTLLELGVTSPTASAPTALIDSGPIVGVVRPVTTESNLAVNAFLGIPYAAPPVRFARPQHPNPWTDPFAATSYKPACVQQFSYPEASRNRTIEWFNTPGPPAGESEDCLNLNIYAPQTAASWSDWTHVEGKAVMVWFHGGSLRFGTNSIDAYDGSLLAAEQDVIIVTVNYRMNVFGFPGAPGLPLGGHNLGFLDQRFALRWVQRNIHAFGGDPAKVTIFGESAGSSSIDAMLTQPDEPLTYRAAILQSGQITLRAPVLDPAAPWRNLSETLGCAGSDEDILACMRALPASALQDAEERLALSFQPIPDNTTFSTNARGARLASTPEDPHIARVPVLVGTDANEGTLFLLGQNNLTQYLTTLLQGASSSVIATFAAFYQSAGATDYERIDAVFTDYSMQCPAAIVTRETAEVGIPAWRYFYNASFPNAQLFPGSGVFHSSEIISIFGTYPREGATEWQEVVSQKMRALWAGFAKDPEVSLST